MNAPVPTELLPCPFCGSRCVTLLNGGPGNYFVRCDDCLAASNDVQRDHAVELWNRRPAPRSEVLSGDAKHYLSAIRKRLEQLYDASADNPRLREQLSDEVDWVDAQLESPAPAQAAGDCALLPRRLTAENGAKYALIGEFHEDFGYLDDGGNEHFIKVPVTWDTIKRIWVAAVAHFDKTSPVPSAQENTP